MQKWRLIYSGKAEPYWNMAVDEALFLLCQAEPDFPPTLRVYDWSEPAVTIGYFQTVEKAVNLNLAEKQGIKVVRRVTGGRAVLHYGELTYSMAANGKSHPELGRNLAETYRQIAGAFAGSLQMLGIRAEQKRGKDPLGNSRALYAQVWQEKPNYSKRDFQMPCFQSSSTFELSVGGKKILGSAQRRSRECFIQQGSLPRQRLGREITDVLQPGGPEGLFQHTWDERVSYLDELLGRSPSLEELSDIIRRGFERFLGATFGDGNLTSQELELAERLKEEKYALSIWNKHAPAGCRAG
ncbi:MAG: lipoate--protein ligase family protein [candidate division Zixibacteria bacterium]|nr:lipoate--protein ligase family protein [candidate division Zixibacteria bacterium]